MPSINKPDPGQLIIQEALQGARAYSYIVLKLKKLAKNLSVSY
jgi:hypothetical protein